MADGASSSGSRGGGESVVIDYGRRRTTCGYCRSTGPTSISHGLWANSLKADDYQALLDRGWRRSGCFLYKPEMERTCCPSYTIRLKANDFICSKEQGRVVKKMHRFLDGELDAQVESSKCKSSPTKRSLSEPVKSPTSKLSKVSANEFQATTCSNISNEDEFTCTLSKRIDEAVDTCFQGGIYSSNVQLPKAVVKTVKPQVKKKVGESVQEKKGDAVHDLVYTCNISFQIVAAVRRALPKEKNSDQGALLADISPNSVAEKLAMTMKRLGEVAGFEVKACNGHLNFYSATNQRAQNHAGNNAPAQILDNSGSSKQTNMNNARHSQKRRNLEIRMSTSHFDPEEYALYRRYQTIVHKEKTVSESSYKRFLVDTPIVFVPPRSDDNTIPRCGFGSFHQQYRIDGKLVAVGVVDILPKCLSSKYLFWDPDLAFLSLGKYTALKEIDWVKTTQEHCPSLQYYYLGYYIHSCNKMRYKAAYRPSELLCPVRYEWVRYDLAKPLLDQSQYSILSDFDKVQDEMAPHICGPNTDSSAKTDSIESASDEDDEDLNDYESDMMVDDNISHSEKADTTEDGSNIKDIENVILDLNGSRVKYKDLQQVFGPIERRNLSALEGQLSKYVRVVGKELSDRMVYSLT